MTEAQATALLVRQAAFTGVDTPGAGSSLPPGHAGVPHAGAADPGPVRSDAVA